LNKNLAVTLHIKKIMKTIITACLVIFISCNTNSKVNETAAGVSKDLNTVKIDNKKDPVCGMPIKGDVGDTTLYNGNVLGFCSSDCKGKFLKNPAQYIAAAEISK